MRKQEHLAALSRHSTKGSPDWISVSDKMPQSRLGLEGSEDSTASQVSKDLGTKWGRNLRHIPDCLQVFQPRDPRRKVTFAPLTAK